MNDLADTTLSLVISRRFDVAPERVFDAWVTNAWAQWLPPAGATCEIASMDPRVGGGFEVRIRRPDGRISAVRGTYREIQRPERLVLSWHGDYGDAENLITVTFAPDGAGTLMTLRQEGFSNPDYRGRFNDGWTGPGGSFDKLARHLGD